MDWSTSLGSSSRALATEHQTCANCGSSNIEEDTIHMLVACQDCGAATQGGITDMPVPYSAAPLPQRMGEKSMEQIRVFSKEYSEIKLAKIIKETKNVAEAAKLSKAKTEICIEQAKELNRRGTIGKKNFPVERVAAALVYAAWKRENPAISAWDMRCMRIKPQLLLKTTKQLCDEHPNLVSMTNSFSDEDRLRNRLERFQIALTSEERKRVLGLAEDIWSLMDHVKVQSTTIRRMVPINDYSILAVAMENVKRRKLSKPEITSLADKLTMTEKTVATRIWKIKKGLVALAAKSPSLEKDVRKKIISTRNIERFLDRLIQNKEFLVTSSNYIEDDFETDEARRPSKKRKGSAGVRRRKGKARTAPMGPVVLANAAVTSVGMMEGDDESLSELEDEDAQEYILNEKEVEVRKQFMGDSP